MARLPRRLRRGIRDSGLIAPLFLLRVFCRLLHLLLLLLLWVFWGGIEDLGQVVSF